MKRMHIILGTTFMLAGILFLGGCSDRDGFRGREGFNPNRDGYGYGDMRERGEPNGYDRREGGEFRQGYRDGYGGGYRNEQQYNDQQYMERPGPNETGDPNYQGDGYAPRDQGMPQDSIHGGIESGPGNQGFGDPGAMEPGMESGGNYGTPEGREGGEFGERGERGESREREEIERR